jgi:hypothetical protein
MALPEIGTLDRLSLDSSKPCGLWRGWLRSGDLSAKKRPGMVPQNRETVPYAWQCTGIHSGVAGSILE